MWLDGKRVVVLGGTNGIGRAVAQAAQEEGATVTVASSSAARLKDARGWLAPNSKAVKADLANEEEIKQLFGEMQPFDHLVYTAGEPLLIGMLADLDLTAVRRFFEVRFWGAYAAARYAAPLLRSNGSITFSSGTASQRPGPGQSALASALAGIEGLTRAFAIELAPLRVNVVVPDVIGTDLWSGMDEASRTQFYADASARLPLGRVGEAGEVAQAYLYAMRQQFMTGQSIFVDGGRML